MVWSVATPILIAEGLAEGRARDPWLKRPGFVVTSLLFPLGCVSTAAFSRKSSPFVASHAQFLVSGVLVVLAVALAFTATTPTVKTSTRARETTAAPPVWVVSMLTLLLATAYLSGEPVARSLGLPPAFSVVFRLACEGVALASIVVWSRRSGWSANHYRAIGVGTATTYFLFGLNVVLHGHTNLGVPTDAIDVAGQVALGGGVLLLAIWPALAHSLRRAS